MTTVRELITRIGFEVEDKKLKDLDRAIKDIGKSIVAVGAAGAAAAAGLFGMAKSVADLGTDLKNTSARIGLDGEKLQELGFAAERAGIDFTTLTDAMTAFNRRIGAAANGTGPAVAAYERLGIKLRDARGQIRSTDSVLAEVADKFQKIQNPSERAALAQDIFNESGRRMIDMLSLGSQGLAALGEEARRTGMIMDKEALENANTFGERLQDLQAVFRGLKIAMTRDLIPALSEVMENLRDFAIANREVIASSLKRFIEGVIQALKGLWQILTTIGTVFMKFSEMVGGVENALKILLSAFTLFKGLALLKNLFIIIAAFKTLGIVAFAAKGAIFAIPLAIIALGAALVWGGRKLWEWISQNEEAMKWLTALWEDIGPVFTQAWEDIKEAFSEVSGFFSQLVVDIKEAWGSLLPFFSELWEDIKTLSASIAPYLQSGIIAAVKYIGQGIKLLTKLLVAILKGLRDAIVWTFNFLKDAIEASAPAWEVIKEVATRVFNGVLWLIEQVIEGFKSIKEWGRSAFDFIAEWISKVSQGAEDFIDLLSSGFSKVSEWASSAFQDVVDFIDLLSGGFSKVLEWVSSGFESVVDFIDLLSEGFSRLGDLITSVFQGTLDFIELIASGFTKLTEWASSAFQGVVDFIATIKQKISDLFETIASWFQGAGSEGWKFVNGFLEGLGSIVSFITGTLSSALQGALGFVGRLGKGVWEVASNIASSVGNRISGAFETAKGFVRGEGRAATKEDTGPSILSRVGDAVDRVGTAAAEKISQAKERVGSYFGYEGGRDILKERNVENITNLTDHKVETIERRRGVLDGIKNVMTGQTPSITAPASELVSTPSSLQDPILGRSAMQQTSTTRNVNVNSEVNMTVPAGTSEAQQQFLREAARAAFREEYESELERVLFENPVLE